MIEFMESWEDHLHLAEFSSNNSYQTSIKMASLEALYGRKCNLHCVRMKSEKKDIGIESYSLDNSKVRIIWEHLRAEQKQAESWAVMIEGS